MKQLPVALSSAALAVAILALAGCGGTAEVRDQPAEEAAVAEPEEVEITAKMLVDFMVAADQIDLEGFCASYRTLNDHELAFGAFAASYEDNPDAPPAREVFNEIVARC